MNSPDIKINSYHPGRSWYYKQGGRILFPSEIKAKVKTDNYPDFMIEDILKASNMAEPKRSERLRGICKIIRATLRTDLATYLRFVRKLKARRLDPDPPEQSIVSCVYVAMSLKHNHIYHGYAKLMICEHHLTRQGDLFGLL